MQDGYICGSADSGRDEKDDGNMNDTRQEQDFGKKISDACGAEVPNPKVGIFWVVKMEQKDLVIADAVPYEKGEPYGVAIQYGGHYDFWEMLKPKSEVEKLLKSRSYDTYPRGRVVFFPDTGTFCVYLDGCLTVDNLAAIFHLFKLDSKKFRITLRRDGHYQCAVCNLYWIEF